MLPVTVVVTSVAGFLAGVRDDQWRDVTTIPELRELGIVYVADMQAFVVHTSDGLLGLHALSPHLGWEPISFCRSSNTFVELAHGSLFDRSGRYLAGPAPRGLDRIPVREWRGVVQMRVGLFMTGPPRDPGSVTQPSGPLCYGGTVGPPGLVSPPR